MTRIGFAYNQKPDPATLRLTADADPARQPEEPSSRRRKWNRRSRVAEAGPEIAESPAAVSAEPASHLPLSTVNDKYAEWDSAQTIDAVERALEGVGEVIRLEATADFPERLRVARPDIVFNIAEGMNGANREAHVPAICEFLGIPYSGSDPFTLAMGLDKARTKEYLAYNRVPTAPFVLVRAAHEVSALLERVTTRRLRGVNGRLRLPLFVKPVHEGSSKGITERNFCRTPAELAEQTLFLLERYEQPVLVEEWLPGAEFTCAVLGNGAGARVLPIVGMNFDALPEGALPVYGFEAKWLWDRPDDPLEIFECPADIDSALQSRVEQVALAAYFVLGCRDWSRIDVRLDADGVPNVVEVNPLPGILPDPRDNSCFPKAARAAGMNYDQLIQACLRHAAERQGVRLAGKAARRPRRAAATG
jgi:D-alanine-D-alanine ligase